MHTLNCDKFVLFCEYFKYMELTMCTPLCYPRSSQQLNSLFWILDYETVQFRDYNVLQEPATSTYRVDENDEVPLLN